MKTSINNWLLLWLAWCKQCTFVPCAGLRFSTDPVTLLAAMQPLLPQLVPASWSRPKMDTWLRGFGIVCNVSSCPVTRFVAWTCSVMGEPGSPKPPQVMSTSPVRGSTTTETVATVLPQIIQSLCLILAHSFPNSMLGSLSYIDTMGSFRINSIGHFTPVQVPICLSICPNQALVHLPGADNIF